jgi:hypothetical protein
MRLSFFFLFIVLFISCNSKEREKSKVKTYFDLEGYFKKEALRLSKKNRPILKTVWINGKSEQKTITIKNWEKEFGVFIDADINKASWRGSFKKLTKEKNKERVEGGSYILSSNELTTYTSNSNKIPVKKIEVIRAKGKVRSIKVYIYNSNDLYASQDTLSYFPDSLYEIKKVQHIKLLEEKKYQIVGEFKR